MAISLPDNPNSQRIDLPELALQTIREQIVQLEKGRNLVRIPQRYDRQNISPGSAFHTLPELFFQLRGLTVFECPGQTFRLYPGQMCVLPPMVGHIESTKPYRGAFCNLVFMFQATTFSFHLAVATPQNRPAALCVQACVYAGTNRILTYLDDAISAFHGASTSRYRYRGAMLAVLGHLAESLQRRDLLEQRENPKVWRVRQIIATHMSDPKLTVGELARRLGCSADYLSNLFRVETGFRLTRYLNEQRIQNARFLLEQSDLNVSEIAWACGYRDPGYFSRQFRRITGLTPREYRKQYQAKASVVKKG